MQIALGARAVALIRWTTGLLPYTAAVTWAFAGAVAGATSAGEPLLADAAATGLAGVLAAAHDVTQFSAPKGSGCQVCLTHGGARALGDLE
jgi:hypothetical protein